MDPLVYNSEYLPEVQLVILTSENPQYETLKPMFDEYGYGFMVPNKNIIVIDGEQFIDNFDSSVLKFIEAHEVSHIILNHNGPRNDKDEIEADLGAYILLKKDNRTDSIKHLLKNFKRRHGIKFDEKMTEKIKKHFS